MEVHVRGYVDPVALISWPTPALPLGAPDKPRLDSWWPSA